MPTTGENDMSETPTNTPKVDAALARGNIEGLVGLGVLARQLERDLAISTARIAELERLLSRVRGEAVDLREPHQMDRWEKECDIHASREGGT